MCRLSPTGNKGEGQTWKDETPQERGWQHLTRRILSPGQHRSYEGGRGGQSFQGTGRANRYPKQRRNGKEISKFAECISPVTRSACMRSSNQWQSFDLECRDRPREPIKSPAETLDSVRVAPQKHPPVFRQAHRHVFRARNLVSGWDEVTIRVCRVEPEVTTECLGCHHTNLVGAGVGLGENGENGECGERPKALGERAAPASERGLPEPQ